MRPIVTLAVLMVAGVWGFAFSCSDRVGPDVAKASPSAHYEQIQQEVERKLLGYPKVETLRAYWAEAVRHALSTAGHIDTTDLTPLIRRVAKSTAEGLRASCPLGSPVDRSSLYRSARPAVTRALESLSKTGTSVHDEDVARIVVGSAFIVVKTGNALCQKPATWKVLFPE